MVKRLRLAGLAMMRQRPALQRVRWFITLEDGQGTANIIIWAKLTETYREALLHAQILGRLACAASASRDLCHCRILFNLNGFLRHIDERLALVAVFG